MRSPFALAVAVALSLALTSCFGIKRDFEDSKHAKDAIKTELNVDSDVRFNTYAGTNGSKVVVTVHLLQTPSGAIGPLKAKVTEIVNHTFRAHVDQVNVEL